MRHVRNLLFGLTVGLAALFGSVRSDELERLLAAMSQPTIAHTLPDENLDGEPVEDFRNVVLTFDMRRQCD